MEKLYYLFWGYAVIYYSVLSIIIINVINYYISLYFNAMENMWIQMQSKYSLE